MIATIAKPKNLSPFFLLTRCLVFLNRYPVNSCNLVEEISVRSVRDRVCSALPGSTVTFKSYHRPLSLASFHDAAFISGRFFFEAGTTEKAIGGLSIDKIRAYDCLGDYGVEQYPSDGLFVKI